MKAAFTKESDLFAEKGVRWMDTLICLHDLKQAHRQMYEDWKDILGLTEEENYRAVEQGFRALEKFDTTIRDQARQILKKLEEAFDPTDKIGALNKPFNLRALRHHAVVFDA